MTKLILTAATFAALIASPAFAQARDNHQFSAPSARAVHDSAGHVIGADPDPRVRQQLRFDPSQGD
jgi:hypothetical protein